MRSTDEMLMCDKLSGYLLLQQQFLAIIIKRFIFIRRNWKQLFTQILLPAMFVCIAMTVALTAPQVHVHFLLEFALSACVYLYVHFRARNAYHYDTITLVTSV